jgi:hypothetical protein
LRVTLTTAIAEHLRVDASRNPELRELAKDVQPEEVLHQIEQDEAARTEHERSVL